MRSVANFYRDCQDAVGPQPPLDVMLPDSMGCVLAEDVMAPFDLPVADLAARTLIPFADLPIGIFTALVGGPTFFILLRTRVRIGQTR